MNTLKTLCLMIALAFASCLLLNTSRAQAASGSLTVVYCVDIYPFQFTNDAGEPDGETIDLWKLWSQKTGVKVDFVPATWDDTLAMVREGKVDAHAGLYYSKERDAYIDYGVPIARSDTHIFHHESLPQLTGGKELLPYRIGVLAGDYVEGYLRQTVPGITLEPYADYDAMMADLKNGTLRAFASETAAGLAALKKNDLIYEYQYVASAPLYQKSSFIGVPEGKGDSLAVINEGMSRISDEERTALGRKWLHMGEAKDSNTLIIAIDRNYAPLYYVDANGNPKGLFVDLWKEWALEAGVQVDFRPSIWAGTLEALKAGAVDIHGGLLKNREREQWVDFSEPFYEVQAVLFFKPNVPLVSLSELAGNKVGAIAGSYHEAYLKENYPDVDVVSIQDTDSLIFELLKGSIDAFINDSIIVATALRNLGLQGALVRYSKPVFTSTYRAGVVKGRSELLQQINNGLGSFPGDKFVSMEERWIDTQEDRYVANTKGKLKLSEEERSWIGQHPVLRVAATPDWPPFEYDENGKYRGVAADILRFAAERVGLKLDIQLNDWTSVMRKLKNGELDICPAIVKTSNRENDYGFTNPFLVSLVGIWVKSSSRDIHSMDDLRGKIVAVEEGYSTHERAAELYPDIKLHLVKSPIDAIMAVSSGQADAYLGNQSSTLYLMKKNVITNLEVVGFFKESSLDLRMGVRKDWPILVGIMNKALETLSLKEKSDLLAQYVGSITSTAPVKEAFVLSVEEKKWIAEHANIRLGVDPALPPFAFFQGVTFSGLSAEYVNQLAQDTGLSFAAPPIVNWSDAVRMVGENKLDVIPGISRTPETDKQFAFTKSYGKYPIVIYQRTDTQAIRKMDELHDKTIAVVEGYAVEELLQDNHPDITVKPYMNLEKGLRALSEGTVDALAGNVVAVEFAKQQFSLFNVVPVIKTPYTLDLRFGVRQDWGPLVRIIDKWLDHLGTEAEQALLQKAGVDTDMPLMAENVEERVDFTQLLFIGLGIIIVFGISFILLLFLKRLVRSRADKLYSSHQYKVVGIVVGLLFLCLVVVSTWYALLRLENSARTGVGESLESVLLTTHEALALWERQSKLQMVDIVESPVMRGLTQSLLTLPADKAVLEDSPQLWNIRKFMNKAQSSRRFIEFSILSKNYLNYATSDNADLLEKNVLSIQRPRVLDKAFLGSTLFVPPVLVENDHAGLHKQGMQSLVTIAAPIRDADGQVLAVLLLYYDTSDNYQRIISLGRVGATGETYAFDKSGMLVSESRFDDRLRALGLIGKDQKGVLNLRIADPGVNLAEGHVFDSETVHPLTEGVKNATMGRSGLDVGGYRDYRGMPVFGAWLWDDNLGLGLIAEMDVDEALGSYRLVRNTVIGVILITIMLGSIMTGLSNWIGHSAARSLSKAKDELEDRVEERTAELKKISVAVEQSPAMVFITDVEGTIEYVNPKFSEVTQYALEEAVGQKPRILKSGGHPQEFYEDLWATILEGQSWQGDILNKKKDGKLFWVRNAIAPIFDDEEKLTHFVAVMEDITDRKAQEERFQALLDAAPDAMVIIAQSGAITLVNIATEELFGFSREEMVGQKVEMLLPEYIRAAHPAHRDKFFATPGDMSLVAGKEFFGQTKSGNHVPVDISLNPIETEDGLQIIASIRDVTERKKAEAAIAESEERTRLILSSAGEGIFGVNLKGEVIFINEAACAMVGFSSEELMGKGVHEIIHHSRPDGSFYPVEECPMRHAFAEGLSSRIDDEVLWRKDGTSFPVEYSAMPVYRGEEKIGAVISFQDVTERKQAEEALRRSEERFRSYFEHSQIGMAVTSPSKGWVEVNPTQLKMLGYSLEELRELTWLDITHPDDIAADIEHFDRMVAGKIHNYNLDKRFIRKDGEVIYTNLSVACIRDDKGEVSLVLASLLDITKRVMSEQERDEALQVITSSIQYASRIQRSVLPPIERINALTTEHFVVWKPRDVVGGDLYWCERWGRGGLIMLGDCTGHGVPGAFMTLLSTGAFERALLEVPPGDSAMLVSRMHQMIQMQLGQDSDANETGSDDGLELGICYINQKKRTITFAGARMPLFIDDGQTIDVLKSDKKGIAYRGIPYDFEYTNHEIKVAENMRFFMTTDGIIDQVGGEKGRGFGKKRFISLLESLRETPLQNQGEKIYNSLQVYQGKEKRRDDVSIIGFKL